MSFTEASPAGGGGVGAAVPVTVTADSTDPLALLATSVYVVVAVGETVRDPFALTGDPSRVIVAAFDVDHCSCVLWPLWIEVPIAMSSRSEEHTSELQSQSNLVCRLL